MCCLSESPHSLVLRGQISTSPFFLQGAFSICVENALVSALKAVLDEYIPFRRQYGLLAGRSGQDTWF